MPKEPSKWESLLLLLIRSAGLPEPESQYHFDPTRKSAADFAYPDLGILIECEGGTWAQGRHTRGAGFENDCTKYNLAAMAGWMLLRFTGDMIEDGRAIETIRRAIEIAKASANDKSIYTAAYVTKTGWA